MVIEVDFESMEVVGNKAVITLNGESITLSDKSGIVSGFHLIKDVKLNLVSWLRKRLTDK